MGIWIELGVFLLALAFGLWQIHDVKKAREASARRRAEAEAETLADTQASPSAAHADAGTPGAETARPEHTRPPA